MTDKLEDILKEPMSCTDGSSHYLEESEQRYLTFIIKQELEEQNDGLWCGALQEAGLDIGHPSELKEAVAKKGREVAEEIKREFKERAPRRSDGFCIEEIECILDNLGKPTGINIDDKEIPMA